MGERVTSTAPAVFDEFARYLEDYGRLGGGEMKAKWGDDPMLGYGNVLQRLRAARGAIRASLAKRSGATDG